MEENKETTPTPVDPDGPISAETGLPAEPLKAKEPPKEPQQEPKAPPVDNPNTAGAQPAKPSRDVTLKATISGSTGDQTASKNVRFNTVLLLKEVQALDDAAAVEIVATRTLDGKEVSQTLLKGTKAECVEALEQSIVKPEQLIPQFQQLIRFLVDHSTLKAVGVELVCTDEKGDTAGAGFVSTTDDCTIAQAVALVNCGDANLDEFVAKAKLNIPGRGSAGQGATIITPTPEQVRKLG